MFYRCSNIPSQISSKVVSIKKVLIVMDRVPEILQCHSQFRIALAEAVKNWDEVGVVDFREKVVLIFVEEAESGSKILQHISRRKRSGTSLSPLFPSRSSSRSTRTLSTTSARLPLSSMIIIVIINIISVATIFKEDHGKRKDVRRRSILADHSSGNSLSC